MKFLQQVTDKIPGKVKLDSALNRINGMEYKLKSAEVIKQFLKNRKQQLKEQLNRFGFAKEFKKMNRTG